MPNKPRTWDFLNNWPVLQMLEKIGSHKDSLTLPQWESIVCLYKESCSIQNTDLFKNPNLIKWENIDPVYDYFIRFSKKEKEEYLSLINNSNMLLSEFGGDPHNFLWDENFRPLRLSREEDWSDWLAYLIKISNGTFIERFLNLRYKSKTVEREFIADSSRADIVIEWEEKEHGTHIEVKVGDPNLEKTHGTSFDIRKAKPDIKYWHDFILLLDSQIENWNTIDGNNAYNDITIKHRTWSDVAISIRKCLYSKEEDLLWRSIAYMLTGCIEVKLYRAHPINEIKSNRPTIDIYNQCNILQRSLDYGIK